MGWCPCYLLWSVSWHSGEFFVGTKSVFNKDAKINFAPEDIDVNHGHAPGLVAKLKDALKYFPKLGINGVAQGDLLFTDDKKFETIDGREMHHFQTQYNYILHP